MKLPKGAASPTKPDLQTRSSGASRLKCQWQGLCGRAGIDITKNFSSLNDRFYERLLSNVAAPLATCTGDEDTTAPVLFLPGTVTVNATSPAGAAVTFAVSAEDDLDGTVTPVCSAASGVVVRGADAQLSDLIALVQQLNAKNEIVTSLDAKLTNAQEAQVETLRRLASKAERAGSRVLRVAGSERHVATSGTHPVAYEVSVEGGCSCRGYSVWHRCGHHALLLSELGQLPDLEQDVVVDERHSERCRTCRGEGYVRAYVGGGLNDWTAVPCTCTRQHAA